MKFSVLLPTRNRLNLLRYAVESVMRQDDPDWEIVISDNQSDDDVAAYVASLNDARIRCSRTDTLLPVTDNWNRCLEQTRGDYVIMLGDDDALMPGYFSTMRRLLDEHGEADVVVTDAHIFAYPNVLPDYPTGFLRSESIGYFPTRQPHWLDPKSALDIVRKTMAFELAVPFNMQYSLISTRFIHSLAGKGPYFQSTFPDYYAATLNFLLSSKVLIYKQPLVVIGIHAQSHGYFYYNNRSSEAQTLLAQPDASRDPALAAETLPGDWILTGWLSAVLSMCQNYPSELAKVGLGFDRNAYRRQAALRAIQGVFRDNTVRREQLSQLARQLSLFEKLAYLWPAVPYQLRAWLGPEGRRAIRRLLGRGSSAPDYHVKGYNTILDVLDNAPTHLPDNAP